MTHRFWRKQLGGLTIGLLLGLLLCGAWPRTPLHAVATDRADNIIVCTCPVEEGIEAICFLDSLTGILRVAVPPKVSNVNGSFQAQWHANVNTDLKTVVSSLNAAVRPAHANKKTTAGPRKEIAMPQAPKYLMVSGMMDINVNNGPNRVGKGLIYVAEANTGVVLAYSILWNNTAHAKNQPISQSLNLWAGEQFSSATIRQSE